MLTSPGLLRGIALIATLCTTRAALAEQATILLHDGTRVTGELREYVPEDHVTLTLDDHDTRSFAAGDVAALQLGADQAPPPAAVVTTEDPRIHALRVRRYDARKNRVSIALPVVLITRPRPPRVRLLRSVLSGHL